MADGLGPAGDHHVGVAAADRLPCLADGVPAGGARGDDAEVRSARAILDGDEARDALDDAISSVGRISRIVRELLATDGDEP